MERNNDMKTDSWVDDHLNKLSPSGDWKPDGAGALARVKRRTSNRRGRKWTFGAVVVIGVCFLTMAFPEQRAQAERACIGACETLFNTSVEESESFLHQFHHLMLPVHMWAMNLLGGGKVTVKIGSSGTGGAGAARDFTGAARDFTVKDSTGATLRLSDYRGKVVLLNFWATWCRPCQTEIPWFVEFERMHHDQGLAVIGISMDDEGWKAVKPYMEAKQVNYRIALDDGTVAQRYGGVESLPETLLIDRTGKIAFRHVGLAGKVDYEDEILQLLRK
jgi:peroxiredoxin